MKAIFSLISLLVVVVIIWILYVEQMEEPQGVGMLEKKERTEIPRATMTPTPYPQYSQPRAARGNLSPMRYQQQRTISKRSEIFAVARETKVNILSYTEQGNQAVVVCEASEHFRLGDFIDVLTRRGIVRDFEHNRSDFKLYYDRTQRRHYQTRYVLKW